MPTFISVQGEWKPATEHAVLPHMTGKFDKEGKSLEVYDGPDRASLHMLWEQSGKPTDPKQCMTSLGSSFKKDPEFIARVRQMGFNSIDEYLKAYGYDDKAELERMNKLATTVTSHQVVKRARELDLGNHGGIEQGSGKELVRGAIGDVAMPV